VSASFWRIGLCAAIAVLIAAATVGMALVVADGARKAVAELTRD
jgi:hypothetical protein